MSGHLKEILSLNIARRILLGYLILAAFTILLGVFFLSSLDQINTINKELLETDAKIISSTDLAIETLLSQEQYGRRYTILKTPEMMNLFWERNVAFKQTIESLNEIPVINPKLTEQISALHKAHTESFTSAFEDLMKPGKTKTAEIDKKLKEQQTNIISLLDNLAMKAHANIDEKNHTIADIGQNAYRIAVALCSLALITGVSAAAIITRSISDSVATLKAATEQIAAGEFDNLPQVHNKDELGDLSKALGDMSIRIKTLEEMYLDASPLTHLPGGVAVDNILSKRLESKDPIAFCLLDMDNFKAYNDYYGYARGNDLIVLMANTIESTVSEMGEEDDFVGHIGGDDFALISTPMLAPKLAKTILDRFENSAKNLYDPEDRDRGYIISETRQGDEANFPIVSISIAIVTNQSRALGSHLEVGEIAAELKEYAKSIPGNVYVVDHRRNHQ